MYLTACFPAQYYKHAELVRSQLLVIRLSCSSFAVVVVISLSMQVISWFEHAPIKQSYLNESL